MSDLPKTILHPETFRKSQWSIVCPHCNSLIGFDGVFDWGWVIDGIRAVDPASRILPTDFDGVVERHSHYLIFETKDNGVPITKGQGWALERLRIARSFTVMKVWGKRNPEKITMVFPDGHQRDFSGSRGTELVKWWYTKADATSSQNTAIDGVITHGPGGDHADTEDRQDITHA